MNASAISASAAAVVPCWSCKGPVAARALFCSVCGAVQGPGTIDHYTRLGMAPSFDIDLEELQKQYFGFQRRLHPDRFASKSPKERALSQSQATALNEAHETLKDPLKRAAYLLALRGHPVDLTACGTINDRELLMEQMEKREALAEAETPEQVAKLAMENESEVIACQCHISAAFNADNLDEAAHLSIRLKYLVKLAEEARSKKSRVTRKI
ncbi:Fe-S protein assembly co-chaperone HscB [Paramagnetospirillum marisnigri]|uniref:Co-chaperone protein HscB homolog n=1 Tax=Paramagnetospirillum marisnigri TaxID=1285242 RepID=A0A178MX21_9PROT|nr:Fe-S protein assembly co-chaperone HscB [Paramagnetospirillum marisnigri]OAN54038.1 Fe-S protein assembly co-chaperone HscB [Paramagnetospirillum marisnigri]